MFGGGRADLSLVDENDPLNCGIEISAKPPGKQLQSVSLLSGGERTMTAVALLFAIYMVRPSPFCILDEMDAPLDESNINRFIKVLRPLRFAEPVHHHHPQQAHHRESRVLYGVTMEERGISKLVGMKLAAERGSRRPVATDLVEWQRPRLRTSNRGRNISPSRARPKNSGRTRGATITVARKPRRSMGGVRAPSGSRDRAA